jgi:hypothetical protein
MTSLSNALAVLKAEERDAPEDAAFKAQCTVTTASQKAVEKMERKARKRGQTLTGQGSDNGVDLQQVQLYGWEALQVKSVNATCGRASLMLLLLSHCAR